MDILAPNIENVLSSHGKLQTNYVSAIAWLYCACVEGLTTIYAQGPPPPPHRPILFETTRFSLLFMKF